MGFRIVRKTVEQTHPIQLERPVLRIKTRTPRGLDFDIETINGSFDDPSWSVNFITCVAWSWLDEDEAHSEIATEAGIFTKPQRRAKMLKKLVDEIRKADFVTGHNLLRFDLLHINAECMRLGLETLPPLVVQDTMRITRAKGFKKGQDNIGTVLGLEEEKEAMNWAQWWKEYGKTGWPGIRSRAETDVLMHKSLRIEMLKAGMLKPPVRWRP